MRLILPVCLFALASHTVAQQRLHASTDTSSALALYEIESYDTAPQPILLPDPFNAILASYPDIAVPPSTGKIVAMEFGIMGQSAYLYDPELGLGVGFEACLYTSSNPQLVTSMDADHDGTLYGHEFLFNPGSASTAHLMRTEDNPVCFTGFGPLVPINVEGDVAFDRDGSLVSTRDGSTSLDRIDRTTGAVTPFGDPGIAFAGLEIDTDGTVYGLTSSGALYRVDRSTFLTTFLVQLPPNPYTGLAFREPAGRLDPTLVCTAQPNSTGQSATLRAQQLAGPAPGSVVFEARSLPSSSFGLLLVAPATGTTSLGSGTLCLGPGFQRVPNALLSSLDGEANFTLDLTAVPGHGATQSGDRLYFQAWFRDASPTGQATSNLTSALGIDFLF